MPAKDYNNYMREYMSRRYYKRRAEWIEKLGGVCTRCGAGENLHFDHVDSTKKSFSVAKGFAGWSQTRLEAEMEKCQLLCEPCHVVKTAECGDIMLGRGRRR